MKIQFFGFFILSIFIHLGLSAQLKPYDEVGEMIKINATSPVNPTYKVPCGTVNFSAFLTSAITAGDAVKLPLSYFSTNASSGYYINYSFTSTVLERGKSCQLTLTTNKTTTVPSVNAYVFADWNADGVFETNLGKYNVANLSNAVAGTNVDIGIPADAHLGKTRIRVHFTSADLASVEADAPMTSGYIYDFVLFVTEKTIQNDLLLTVSSNNIDFGAAIINTPSPTSNGRYPAGTVMEIQAIKKDLSNFVGWSNGTSIVSTEPLFSFPLNQHTYLIALFETLTATLEAPVASTDADPVWYQIKNAQTDVRLNRFIAYSTNIPAGYTTELRIEKPEDFTDKFLWRLQASANGLVKLVNKGTNKQIYSAGGGLNEVVTVADLGSDFFITPSGNPNGSYSVKYNNLSTRLLNGGIPFNIVLYDAGVGTGSGWYFYRVPILSSTKSVENPNIKVLVNQNNIRVEGIERGDLINIYNLLGHDKMKLVAADIYHSFQFEEKGLFIVTVSNQNGFKQVKKILK